MSYTARFSENYAVLAKLYPDARAAAVYNTAWASVAEFHRVAVLIDVGEMVATATLDVLLQEASDNAGTGLAAIGGKGITQLTQAGGDGNDFVIIELRTEELVPGNAFIRANVTVANAAVDLAVTVVGFIGRFPPVALTLVTEVVP